MGIVFAAVFLGFSAALALLSPADAKVIRGTVSSREAWEENGKFVTKFCFHDRKALFRFTINATASGSWYFYLDNTWPHVYSEQDCHKKIAAAKFSMSLSNQTSGHQYLHQWLRPHFWFVIYADNFTCDGTPPLEDEVIQYEMVFFNPDSNGQATDHFGDDYRGLLTFYSLLVLVYFTGIGLYAHSIWLTINKGGPMHEVLKMLSIAMVLHFIAALLMLLHLWRYSVNGEGVTLLETMSEIFEMLAQCQMIWMLLSMSVGWTLGSSTAHPIRDKRQLGTITAVAVLHVWFVLWEQSYDESHYTYHVHESLPGLMLVVLRLALTALFAYNLTHTIAEERSILRKDFYQSFAIATPRFFLAAVENNREKAWDQNYAKLRHRSEMVDSGCYLWFLAFPLLMLVAVAFAQYYRHKVVTVGVTIIQTVAMVILSRLFLSRSLYWEVSTLSSTTLPLRGDRGGGGRLRTIGPSTNLH